VGTSSPEELCDLAHREAFSDPGMASRRQESREDLLAKLGGSQELDPKL